MAKPLRQCSEGFIASQQDEASQTSSVWKCLHFPKDFWFQRFSFWNVPLAWQLESCWWFSQLANKQEMLEKEYKEETTEKGNPQFRTAFFGVTNLHWCIKVPKERDEQKLGMVYGSSLNEVLKSSRIRKTWGKHVTFNITAMFSSSVRPVQFRPWTTSRENGRIFHLPALLTSKKTWHSHTRKRRSSDGTIMLISASWKENWGVIFIEMWFSPPFWRQRNFPKSVIITSLTERGRLRRLPTSPKLLVFEMFQCFFRGRDVVRPYGEMRRWS